MSDDRGGELLALERVIAACRAQATALDMPALAHLLDRAAASLAVRRAEAGRSPPLRRGAARAPSAPH